MTFLVILSQKSVRLNVEWVWKKTDVQSCSTCMWVKEKINAW